MKITPRNIFGILTGKELGKSALLGIAEKESEVSEIIEEYNEVFGIGNISYYSTKTSKEDYEFAKATAFKGLFNTLNGPINTVITGLQTTKR